MDVFLAQDQVVPFCKALLEVFRWGGRALAVTTEAAVRKSGQARGLTRAGPQSAHSADG